MGIKLRRVKYHGEKKSKNKMKFKILLLIYIYIILLILASLYNFERENIAFLINYALIPLLISAIISGIFGIVLETISGDFFKRFYFYLTFWKFRVRISLFFLIVLAITLWINFRWF